VAAETVRVIGAALDIAAAMIGMAGAVPKGWELQAGGTTHAYRVPLNLVLWG
jgi:hypothetical protein